MLNILELFILIIITFIIILLYIGVRLTFIYDKKGKIINGCLKVIILKKITLFSFKFPSNNEASESRSFDIKKLLKLAKPCFKYFKLFLEKFLKSIKVNEVNNHIVFGLASYAKTAQYIGYIWAILSIASSIIPNSKLTAQPSFKGEVMDLNGKIDIDINILKLIYPLINLISKKEVRELIKGVQNG